MPSPTLNQPLQDVVSTAPLVHDGDDPWWNVAAHALFRVVGRGGDGEPPDLSAFPTHPNDEQVPIFKHGVHFEPVAILLSNQPKDPHAKVVYTPEKSESAYILAALALRQAALQTAIWVGHVSVGGSEAGGAGWITLITQCPTAAGCLHLDSKGVGRLLHSAICMMLTHGCT